MIANIISPGDKVEMKSMVSVVLPNGMQGIKTYQSSVYDILEDGTLELCMPIEQNKIVLLPVEGEYEVTFFTRDGMYRSSVRIIDREKVDNSYVVVTELISNVYKSQRREYYRFNCMLEMKARELSDEEVEAYRNGGVKALSEWGMKSGVMADISGGGLRFVSKQKYNVGNLALVQFALPIQGKEKIFKLVAAVMGSAAVKGHEGDFENRLKYEYIDKNTREEIIRYIFDAERNNRKNRKV